MMCMIMIWMKCSRQIGMIIQRFALLSESYNQKKKHSDDNIQRIIGSYIQRLIMNYRELFGEL